MLSRLERLPILPSIASKFINNTSETGRFRLFATGFHITRESLPELYSLYLQACDSLCVDSPPPLFITKEPIFNAFALGSGGDKPCISLTAELVSVLDEDELIYVMGHELGHVISGHAKYKWLATLLYSGMVPREVKVAIAPALGPTLLLWSRRSEYTCDRAGLLACQSLETAARVNMRFAGVPKKYAGKASYQSLMEQAEKLREQVPGGWLNPRYVTHQLSRFAHKLYDGTHPDPLERIAELQQWVDEGWYDEIVNGNPTSRSKLAKLLTGDSHLAELMLILSQSLIAVCVKEFNVSREIASPLIRKVIYDSETLKNTPIEALLRIELVIEKISSDKVQYVLILLINKDGNAVRQTFQLPMSEKWEDTAQDIREEFTMKREKQIIRQLYSI